MHNPLLPYRSPDWSLTYTPISPPFYPYCYQFFLTPGSFLTSASSSCLPGQPAFPISFSCVRNYRSRTTVLSIPILHRISCMYRTLRICAPNYPSRVTIFSVLFHSTTNPTHTTLALRLSIISITLLLPPIVSPRSPPLFLLSLFMLFIVTTLPL